MHVHHGAGDVTGRVLLLDGRRLEAGASGYGRIVLDRPVSAVARERFVLRDHQGKTTVAGGRVIDPAPPSRRWRDEARFEALDRDDPADALRAALRTTFGFGWRSFVDAWNLADAAAGRTLRQAGVLQLGEGAKSLVALPEAVAALETEIVSALEAWHVEKPEDPGAPPVALRQRLAVRRPVPFFDAVVERMADAGLLTRAGGRLALPGHVVRFSDMEERLWRRVEPILLEGGIRPPRVREIADELSVDHKPVEALLKRAARMGLIAPVAENRFFPHDAVDELTALARELAKNSPESAFTAQEFKNVSGIGRNVAIQVLEYLDRIGRTKRDGEARRMAE